VRRTRQNIYLALGCIFCALGLLADSWARPPKELNFPALKFTPPHVETRTLSNGVTVFFLPDHELPLINLTAYIRTGSMYEPTGTTGVASLTGTLIRGGGTVKRSREEIDLELELVGASVETGIGVESGSASMSCLTKDIKKTLMTFAEVLRYPVFNKQKLEIEKAKMIEGILRRNDEPFQIARREYRHAIYGKTHALSRKPEIPGVKEIERVDLVEFYGNFFHPGNIMIAVSGDFETEEMVRHLEESLSDWTYKKTEWPKVEVVKKGSLSEIFERRVIYAEKEVNQSSVILGHLGIKRHNPDRFDLEVMNEILGGGVPPLPGFIRKSARGWGWPIGWEAVFLNPGIMERSRPDAKQKVRVWERP